MTSAIKAMLASPAAWRDGIRVDGQPFGSMMADWQRRDFEAMDLAWLAAIGRRPQHVPYRSAMILRGRGASKTTDAAISCAFALCAAPRRIEIVSAADDFDQNALLRDAIDRLRSENPPIRQLLDVQRNCVVNQSTGSQLRLITSDAPSSFGLLASAIILDEWTHWRGRELFDALLSTRAKKRDCIFQVVSNAGYIDSWQYPIYEAVKTEPTWYVPAMTGPPEWIQAELREQERLLPRAAFDRLFLNRWVTGAGDAIDPEDIDAAIRHDLLPMTGNEQHVAFTAALDLGWRRDATSLIVLASDGHTKTVRVADICEWKPGNAELNLMQVEEGVIAKHRQFGFRYVLYDPAQAVLLAQRLRNAGINMREFPFTGPNLHRSATALLDVFRNRRILLYEHENLIKGLRSLRIESKPYGFRLTAPRGPDGHADSAIALSVGIGDALDICRSDTSACTEIPLPFLMGRLDGARSAGLFGSRGLDGDLSPRGTSPGRGDDRPGFGPFGFRQ
jgi:hypothetical protein